LSADGGHPPAYFEVAHTARNLVLFPAALVLFDWLGWAAASSTRSFLQGSRLQFTPAKSAVEVAITKSPRASAFAAKRRVASFSELLGTKSLAARPACGSGQPVTSVGNERRRPSVSSRRPFRELFEVLRGMLRDSSDDILRREHDGTLLHAGNLRHWPRDPAFRAHGVDSPIAIDAALVPRITSANTDAASLMIAEQTGEFGKKR
jgi:hypothetical protein